MRISGASEKAGTGGTTGNKLYQKIQLLKEEFNDVLIVDPIRKTCINVTEYSVSPTNEQCCDKCPLSNDTCGCVCNDVVSNQDKRCRFIYNKTTAYFVIAKPIKSRYNTYVMVLISKLNSAFSFGAYSESEAIDSITKISSNLVIDPLTQIYNRKYLMDNIEYLMNKAASERQNLCLACIDVDNFKKFNDTYGHDFGDKVLKKTAELMTKAVSVIEEAYPIRVGGDEFLIVGVNINKNRFKAIMNKLCIMVDDCKLPYENEKVSIKISIGVSDMIQDCISTYKELYDKADAKLYDAKEAGKGCVR